MQNQTPKTSKKLSILARKLAIWVVLLAMMIQTLSVCSFALELNTGLLDGNTQSSKGDGGVTGIGRLEDPELSEQLKMDYLAYIKKDLLKKVEDYKLSGEVGVILTFSEDSLIENYLASDKRADMTFAEYGASEEARDIRGTLEVNQNAILDRMYDEGLISQVYHTYKNILDGAYVRTTYEQLSEICNMECIQRVTLSNTYNPLSAVENPVNVYDTGIFNSGNVDYTGKGTVVAILDTGCDYTHAAFTTHQVELPKYDRDDIAELLPLLRASEFSSGLDVREVYYGNITGEKIVFGYDYADKDPDIMPYSESHGTHVAGIIGGYDGKKVTGVAIDTQFAIMKVFSDYKRGADDGDIIAALEDSVVLGVDAVNMSLGTSCGFTIERDEDNIYKNELYQRIDEAGISMIVAASNDHSSAFGGENGNTNKTDNPDSGTVGSPSTYYTTLSVASINGVKDYYMHANGNRNVFFTNSYDMGANEYDFFEMLDIKKGESVTYEYVTVPGLGYSINYSGLDVEGKIALVKRGDISFEEKIQYAQENGAIAVIVYNNVFGDIIMTVGNNIKIPAVSIGKDDGDILAAQESGTIVFNLDNKAGPFMSDFSSWGPTPNLKLKPEITAHGGNITSAVIGGYDEMSGTSMAAPNMCGITVLIRQYVRDKYPELSVIEMRDLVYQLCMSTATIALDKNGNPYSPRKQGAGIADIVKSTTTEAYLYVDGINKTKLELGADPLRTGVYEMSINLKNLSTVTPMSFRPGYIAMTESVSTSDPEYVAEMAYLLSAGGVFTVEGAEYADGIITVQPGATAKITLKLTLSAEDKSYLNSTFENGMYVEGFVTFDNTAENGVDLNAPFLAYYGDWGEAPIFDLDFYEEETEAHNNAIDEEDKIKADYYATIPLGTYYYDYLIPLGAYVFEIDESEYNPIPATREHAAISYFNDCISGIYGTFVGLLRNAKELKTTIVNSTTGEVVYEKIEYNCLKSHYSGAPVPYPSRLLISTLDYKTGEAFGWNNEKFEVTLSAVLDWDEGENKSDTYSYSFYIDNEAPTVTGASFYTEYDKSREENRYYLDLMVYDNHYAMACRPVTVYDLYYEDKGEEKRTISSLAKYPIPIYQENIGETTKVRLEITDYLDIIAESDMPGGISICLNDYALNTSIHYIPFPGTDDETIEFLEPELDLDINATLDLTDYLVKKDTTERVESDYLHNLKWTSSDESVVAIKNGRIETLKSGSAVISVSSDSWTVMEKVGEEIVKTPLYKSIVINVSDKEITDNPDSGDLIDIEEVSFAYYNTLFAFNNHITYSAIGSTGSINYFDGSYSVEFYPSEKIQLFPQLKPWNLSKDRYEFIWSSSNPAVATVDENGIVTAEAEGKARITLQVKLDGEISLLAARLSVEVKSEFIIENRTLVAYKGKGGDVVIPDDEGIITIGAFAFSHYYLDNEKEVEKDKHGYYDIDDKKTPVGNTTVTSVVVPEGVETIEKYAFYNSSKLCKVTLPESCETINASAFAKCKVLENINLDNVNIISDMAFLDCESLNCSDLGGINLSNVYTMGFFAFSNTAIEEVSLDYLSRVSNSIFANCKKLRKVTLGERTRIAPLMFQNTAIEEIVVYSDIVSDDAFSGCESLRSVVFKNDMTYLGENAFKDCKKLSSVVFEGDVEEIASFAFQNCSSLTEFTLPDCKLSIGNAVFSNSGLKKLIFKPNTEITDIGITIFEKLDDVDADLSTSKHYIADGNAIYSKDGKTLLLAMPQVGVSSITVPASVETIGSGAFSSVTTMISVNFEAGSKLNYIGKYAFANCISLIVFNMPANNVKIDDQAFYFATSLKDIDLSKVVYLGEAAFAKTALTGVNLTSDNVYIGKFAFNGCTKLRSAVLGKNAKVDESAFAGIASLNSVDLLGDAEIGRMAFSDCTYLKTFDFADITGTIGDFAFAGCANLTEIVAPKLTGIGEGSFANCARIVKLEAPSLKAIGAKAFAYLGESTARPIPNQISSIDLPELESIGEHAFYANSYLESANLPKLNSIGKYAFAGCEKLQSIVYSDKLEEIPEATFYYCTSLSNIDITKIVKIGPNALCGVMLPAELVLENLEVIENMAFAELVDLNYVEKIIAPKLKSIGRHAFAGCLKLHTLYAPALEEIHEAALIGTAIVEFEVFPSLKNVMISAFEGCESFKAFFTTVNGKKEYSAIYENVMIDEGVLYVKNKNGYTLSSYPREKDSPTYTIKEGTVRIEFAAFTNNVHLEKVIMPVSLKNIGNYAFQGCTNLNTVVFNSYYAPVLESTLTGDQIIIDVSTIDSFPGFDELYKYSYYYIADGMVERALYYRNFIAEIGSEAVGEIVAVIPDNCVGYDNIIYNAYFTFSDTTSGVTMGKFAIAFIEAVSKLPEMIDRFDKLLVDQAIVAYNALEGNSDEKVYVSDDVFAKFVKARKDYNVDVATSKIAHIFDVDNSKYTFELIKDARKAFLALTEEEKAEVANADVLTQKISELSAALGRDVDFSLTYEENLPKSEEPTIKDEKTNDMTVVIVVAAVAGVAILAAAAVVLVVVKKKKVAEKKAEPVSPVTEAAEPETEKKVEAEESSDDEASNKEED